MKKRIIGIADTMFSRADMGRIAIEVLEKSKFADKIKIERYTVPGIKDLPYPQGKKSDEQDNPASRENK